MIPKRIAMYVKLQAPKIAGTYADPFDSQISDVEGAKKLCKIAGYRLTPRSVPIWMYVDKHVKPHNDHLGRTLVYLHRGGGSLYVLNNRRLEEARMYKGDVWLFNSRQEHFWMSDTPCTMLVCDVSRRTQK